MTHAKIQISILYAGLTLQVSQNEQGQDITPLKPISDLFGLAWNKQYKKITDSPSFSRYLGSCTYHMVCGDGKKREQTCILLSRVAAFLMSISTDSVRASGNVEGADYLLEKQIEWADALHDYEQVGMALNQNHVKVQQLLMQQRKAFAQMMTVKNQTSEQQDRNALSQIMKQMADEIGVAYQLDLIDSVGAG